MAANDADATASSTGLSDDSRFSFPKEEEKILAFWNEISAFETCQELAKDRPKFTFYDGPPFATGLPHYGHILAGTIKDTVTRYAYQMGHSVDRRFGWDCHGLPVEFEIDKKLGIKGKEDVLKMGIDNYNAECRKIVMRYSSEWERVVNRLGRWIDFKNDYKTLYPWFMESVWWVFKQLFEKGLVYRGFKVMPYSTACNTPLSNFEANQNYKDVSDPAVMVSFPLVDEPDVALVAWTTTPWTLPSNLALCVKASFEYVKVKDAASGRFYILLKSRVSQVYKKEEDYEVVSSLTGAELKGKRYVPLFDYFKGKAEEESWQVLNDDYVTDSSGTGVVHCAPAFGEDDYRVCLAAGVIKKGGYVVCPVDESGRFTEDVTDFAGQHVKEADKAIMKMLKGRNRVVHQGTLVHSYPFCWRSDTPLIYKAVPSWFIRVEEYRDQLLANNDQSHWVPDYVKEKRFRNWLVNARDWAVSRNRFWGTPIPLWVSEDYEEVICIGSIEELKQLSGRDDITDLHRESVDGIEIPSKKGKGMLRRVEEVLDCWAESGSMPYAQRHYPFENKEEFEKNFPADFIAEGIDQTRGWFYTLMVMSTHLFKRPPFKNLIVNGLVLASDGKKMSKRLKNYPDPISVVDKYGADALRLYLINSPVVRGETLRFKEDGVRNVLKDVLLPWLNTYNFFNQTLLTYEDAHPEFQFTYDARVSWEPNNLFDKWIMAFTHRLIAFVHQEMAAYRLYTVIPRLLKYIENLTNWYVRFNRKRFRPENEAQDTREAFTTIVEVLYTLVRLMAPLTPYLSEHLYQNLKPRLVKDESVADDRSVHFLMLPQANSAYENAELESAFEVMQKVVDVGRALRDRNKMPLKTPLPSLVILHEEESVLDGLAPLIPYVQEELNVRDVLTSTDRAAYGVVLKADLDHRAAGKRLGKDRKAVAQVITSFTPEDIAAVQAAGGRDIEGHHIPAEEIVTKYVVANTKGSLVAESNGEVLVLLDVKQDEALKRDGTAREIVNRVQRLRKKAGLQPTESITVAVHVKKECPELKIGEVLVSHNEFLSTTLRSPILVSGGTSEPAGALRGEEEFKLSKALFKISLHEA